MAWQPPIGLTCVDVLVQHEVMAAGFPVRKVALFAQKILTSCLSCSNAWPLGPFITWHWLPSPTMTIFCTSPGPFVQVSYGLFLFCRVPAKYSFPIQGAETGPSRPGSELRSQSTLVFPQVRINQPRAFDTQLEWPLQLLGSSRSGTSLGRSAGVTQSFHTKEPSDAPGCKGNTPGFKLCLLGRRVAAGVALSLSEPRFLLV